MLPVCPGYAQIIKICTFLEEQAHLYFVTFILVDRSFLVNVIQFSNAPKRLKYPTLHIASHHQYHFYCWTTSKWYERMILSVSSMARGRISAICLILAVTSLTCSSVILRPSCSTRDLTAFHPVILELIETYRVSPNKLGSIISYVEGFARMALA